MRVTNVTAATHRFGTDNDHFNGYASVVRRFGMLESEHEQELARRWKESRDQDAVHALVTSHLRLAHKVARSYQGYGLPLADLMAEASVGLVLAASKYQPDRGSRFSTYAAWWIRASIHEYILRSWSLVKIGTTAAQKKLFFRLRGEKRRLKSDAVGVTPELAEQIARSLAVTPREVIDMDCRLSGDLSLNSPVNREEGIGEWQDMLQDEAPNAELLLADSEEGTQQADAMHAAVNMLTGRERRVLVARRLTDDPPTLDQLARELSISSERVRQIEVCAFMKVKRAARHAVARENCQSTGCHAHARLK
ncbi:RNA polymerase factor sigma-32 [Bradyrhizobium sp. 15]|nr:RNA polymerase factor sigma-32 [Bradyrhizobium sp. 15]MCK1316602.1 RNA polymerase factor sigma-32 [Bradyrhizobium sp. 23]MCK1439746.1 RNA polymerase factor sigma-32 [Bradyrhizobium sp. 15]